MGLQFVSAYSWWFLPLCLITGAALAWVLYYKNRSDDFSLRLRWLLAVFRFVSGSLIAFLLLAPMVKTSVRNTEKPVVVIGIDNSRSMTGSADSVFVRQELRSQLDQLAKKLGSDFEVVSYTFGEEVKVSDSAVFSENMSDIGSFIRQVSTRYYNRNLGAMIMATDGIYNAGTDPAFQADDLPFPVYTINTGDTTQRRDILIKKINYNRTAYKGNRFPLEILIQAFEASGKTCRLEVNQNGAGFYSQDLRFTSDKQLVTVPVMASASETGKVKFRIAVSVVEDEVNESNNVREIIVEVKESRQKIAIIAHSPHPDLAAIERSLGNSNNFETNLITDGNFTGNLADYSMVILHQLPSQSNRMTRELAEIERLGIPVLFILGSQSDISAFNTLRTGIQITGFNGLYNEALPVINPSFPLFIVSEDIKQLLRDVPPLMAPFGKFSTGNASNVLALQAIGNSSTNMPLIVFSQQPERRIGVIAGEGLWKWRISDFQKNNSHLAFDELLGKMMQYLVIREEKGRFRVSHRDFYAENESIEFGATLLNETGELINDPLVKMTISGDDGNKYEFEFSAIGEAYTLNAGSLKPGLYEYTATAGSGIDMLTQRGSFVVTALNLEDINTVANHQILNRLSYLTGGKSISPAETASLAELISSREDMKPVTYTRKRYTDLLNFYPLLLLIIGLLGAEWFLRKYHGSY